MDPIQMLVEDHQRVKQLFRRFEQSRDPSEKQQIAQQAFLELEVHSALEKQIFYPAVAQKGDKEDKDLVDHSYHDHAKTEQLIGELRSMPATDARYDARFRELIESVEEHAQEEEEQMFPDAQQKLGGDMQRLGQEMTRLKQQMMPRAA
jgi:hemerythrin superfamily protein